MARAHRVGLQLKFVILFSVILVAAMAAMGGWSQHEIEQRTENGMLESAQILASEMDAVWDFMEINEDAFVLGEDGTPKLYCVTASKAVSRLFTDKTDYDIHYTNTHTRRPFDAPDAFEVEVIERMKSDPALTWYGEMTVDEEGRSVYRYVEPLYITESCLKCHGEPEGELDCKGFPKEGQKIGDVAGVASIILPADAYREDVKSSMLGEIGLVVVVGLASLVIIFYGVRKLVTRPLQRLEQVAASVEQGCFDVDTAHIGYRDEVADVATRFGAMAASLQRLTSNLEGEVKMRTAELGLANEELERQREILEQANRQLVLDSQYKSDFLAVMSHELRTPLTSIIAFADMWESRFEPRDADEEQIVREIRANSRAILSIVNDILEMARFEAGKNEIAWDVVDVADVAAGVYRRTQSIAEAKGLGFRFSSCADMPCVVSDAAKLSHVLENLVSNAIKFTDSGGVEIAVEGLPLTMLPDGRPAANPPRDSGCAETADDFVPFAGGGVVVSVSDTGCGIADNEVSGIFRRFSQARAGHHVGGGSGLGLSVVYDMVDALHGLVRVQSKPGAGSTFSVWLPPDGRASGDEVWRRYADGVIWPPERDSLESVRDERPCGEEQL